VNHSLYSERYIPILIRALKIWPCGACGMHVHCRLRHLLATSCKYVHTVRCKTCVLRHPEAGTAGLWAAGSTGRPWFQRSTQQLLLNTLAPLPSHHRHQLFVKVDPAKCSRASRPSTHTLAPDRSFATAPLVDRERALDHHLSASSVARARLRQPLSCAIISPKTRKLGPVQLLRTTLQC
jgi:hypothetical protein